LETYLQYRYKLFFPTQGNTMPQPCKVASQQRPHSPRRSSWIPRKPSLVLPANLCPPRSTHRSQDSTPPMFRLRISAPLEVHPQRKIRPFAQCEADSASGHRQRGQPVKAGKGAGQALSPATANSKHRTKSPRCISSGCSNSGGLTLDKRGKLL